MVKIENTNTNWSILQMIQESDYEKSKKELLTQINIVILYQNNFEIVTKNHILEIIKVCSLLSTIISKYEIDEIERDLNKIVNEFQYYNNRKSLQTSKNYLIKNKLGLQKINSLQEQILVQMELDSQKLALKLNERLIVFFHKYNQYNELLMSLHFSHEIIPAKINSYYFNLHVAFELYTNALELFADIHDKEMDQINMSKLNISIDNLNKAVNYYPDFTIAYILMGIYFRRKFSRKLTIINYRKKRTFISIKK